MDRKSKYALIKSKTGNSKLAQKARDWSEDRINKEILEISSPVLSIQVEKKLSKREIRRKNRYIKARNAGYTPTEAQRMRDWSVEKINNTVRSNIIVNVASRRKRWKYMSVKKKMDPELEMLARRFNKEKNDEMLKKAHSNNPIKGLYKLEVSKDALGNKVTIPVYDKNHGFGWGIVYESYTKGIDPFKIRSKTKIDPFIPEIYRLPNSL